MPRRLTCSLTRRDRFFIVIESHGLPADSEMRRSGFSFAGKHNLKRIFRAGLVAKMEFREFTPSLGKGMKIRRKRKARQLLRQIVGEALPVVRSMQDTVDVIEIPSLVIVLSL